MLKKILLAALVLFPMLASAQSIKIGVVDTQKLMTDLRAEAQKKLEEFQTLAQDASTPDAVKERRAKELDEFSQKLSEFEQMAQQDLQKQQQEILGPVLNNVQQAIQSVGKEGNYTLIQETGALLYFGAPAEDITEQVKARLVK